MVRAQEIAMNSMPADQQPDDADLERQLTVKLPAEWAFPPSWLAVTVFFGLLFVYFNWMPLYHSDLWGHVLYGNWMLEHRRLPAEDPFVPLAQGIPITATAWLSQVTFAAVERMAGSGGLSHLYALTMLAAFALLGRVYFLQTGRADLAIIGVIMTIALSWGRLAFIRPEIFGLLGFSTLLLMLVRSVPEVIPSSVERRSNTDNRRWLWWVGLVLLFLLWANLHGSFAVGLVLLACCTLGRAIEVSLEALCRERAQETQRSTASGSWLTDWARKIALAVLQDVPVRRLGLGTVLATLTTLINPYGVYLLVYTATFSGNINLRTIGEWSRLDLYSIVGLQVTIGWALVIAAFLLARRWPTATCVLLLLVFTLAVGRQTRMLNWFATVAVMVLLPRVGEWLARKRIRENPDSRSRIRENSDPNRSRIRENSDPSKDPAPDPGSPMSSPAMGVPAQRGCEKIGTGTFATADFPGFLPFPLGASPIFSQPQPVQLPDQSPKPNFRYTLLTALAIWICFILSPLGMALVAGRTRAAVHLYDSHTPLDVAMHLREHPPHGAIFSPQPWAEWFLWQGPPGLRVFITTNTVHVVRPHIWQQYRMVSAAHASWDQILRDHAIATVVVEKRNQPALAAMLRADARWKVQYEDELGLVAVRIPARDSRMPSDGQ
jgi:hypothetical protein